MLDGKALKRESQDKEAAHDIEGGYQEKERATQRNRGQEEAARESSQGVESQGRNGGQGTESEDRVVAAGEGKGSGD